MEVIDIEGSPSVVYYLYNLANNHSSNPHNTIGSNSSKVIVILFLDE